MNQTDERYTPESVLRVVRAHASIALDPCTTPANPTGARAFLTRAEDGLQTPWSERGLVFCNPPYGRGELLRWAIKVVREAERVADREIILLTLSDLGTRWARHLFSHAQAIAFWHGRIAYMRPDGDYDTGAKQSSAFWYFGERAARFHRVFRLNANVVHLSPPVARHESIAVAGGV